MSILQDGVRAASSRTRSETDVLLDQLRGIQAWTRAHRPCELFVDTAMSRESRLDLARRRDVVERQRRALVDWTARQLQESDHVLRTAIAPRVVLVHRNAWFKSKVASGLEEAGAAPVADLDNGADAVGICVAEQPDVVLLEDKLPMVPGLELTRTVRRYAPSTVVLAQVANDWEIGPFLQAGATAAYTRRTPPADIAADLRALLANGTQRD